MFMTSQPERRAGARRRHRRPPLGLLPPASRSGGRGPAHQPTPRHGAAQHRRSTATGSSPARAGPSSSPSTRGRASSSGSTRWPTALLGYRYTSGPIVVRGKVAPGMTGCERLQAICFISDHDPDTGTSCGRRRPSRAPWADGDTWGDRRGLTSWRARLVDTGQLRPRDRPHLLVHRPAGAVGASCSAAPRGHLYTNSTLALDPETGEPLVLPAHPGRTHDLDEVFEIVLVDRGRRAVALQDGQDRRPVGARSAHRGVSERGSTWAIRTSSTSSR